MTTLAVPHAAPGLAYRFGRFVVQPRERVLLADSEP